MNGRYVSEMKRLQRTRRGLILMYVGELLKS